MSQQSESKVEPAELVEPSATSLEPNATEPNDAPVPDALLADAPKASPDQRSPDQPSPDQPSADEQPPEGNVSLDAAGRERPQFLLSFPQHPDLARLSAAFEAGNYALVRAEAGTLAERAEDPAVKDAALELRRRIEPDPLVKYLLGLTALLLLFLAYFAYNH